jgi:hypothetical protein
VGRRWNVSGVEAAHRVHVLEDRGQLQRVAPDLVFVEGEPGKARHVSYLLGRDKAI